MAVHNVDELLKRYGGDPGKYQIFVLCLLWFCMCNLSLNCMMNLFTIVAYPHHCKIPDDWSKNESIPKLKNDEYDSCLMYIDPTNHSLGTTGCTSGWQFYPPDDEWNIVQEWDLVCDKHYQAALATTLFFAGVTIGAVIFGYLADMFGRKPVMIWSNLFSAITTAVMPFSVNYLMYVILRFIHGFFVQGGFICAFILAVELFTPRRRTAVAIVTQILWPLMLFLMCAFFYFFKSWKTVYLVSNVPFVLTVSYIWLVPESIRWLLAVGKVSRAKMELTRICRFNKLSLAVDDRLTDDIQTVVQKINQGRKQTKQNYGCLDLIKRKKMRIISILSFFFYFVASFAYYGISYAMTRFKISPYISFAATSMLELITILIMYFVLQRIGRKSAIAFCLSVCCVLSLIVAILQLTIPKGNASEVSVTIVAAVGRAAVAGLFSSMPMYINELSPTVLRNVLFGIANCCGRIGAMVAPQVMLLEIYVWKPLPFVICAIITCLAAILTHLLPETKDKPLPDLPENVDALWSNDAGQNLIRAENGNKHEKDENKPLTNSIKA